MFYLTLLLSLVCAVGMVSETNANAEAAPDTFPTVEKLPAIKELPDPFLLKNGTRVKTKADWNRHRKDLIAQVQHYGFGVVPPAGGAIQVDEQGTTHLDAIGATEKKLLLHLGPDGKIPVHCFLTVPDASNAHGRKRMPAIVVGDLCWGKVKPEIVAEVVKRGYILAEFDRTDVVHDKVERVGGLYDLYPAHGEQDMDAFGASAAWAWGFHRLVDYLLTLDNVDAKHIAVTGHSRGGKAVLLAGITDERIALTAPNDAGCMGTGCTRFLYTKGGTVKNETLALIVQRFPFWFSPRLKTFIGHEEQLPFDQHTMKALIAPRALLETQALEDHWANPEGAQVTFQAAKVVFDFLGAGDKIGTAYRPGGHDQLLPDWVALLDFSDHQFFAKPLPHPFNTLQYPDTSANAFTWKAP